MIISNRAVEAAIDALPYQAADYVDTDAMRAALEAAAQYMMPREDLNAWVAKAAPDTIIGKLRDERQPMTSQAIPMETVKFSEVEELADVFTGYQVGLGSTPARLMRGHAHEIAAAILAAGYRRVAK